ncbi:MAG TPA: efflux RND transporter permease subunit [Phycisphaerae bacterium]|nr:efflux RND transporter permease subunit [Phycisphaerales bacterium]HRX83858.1 efflux RND transporter permease subunit [Phycisphaerae bacterium]
MSLPQRQPGDGLIGFMARNHVAANLLMLLFVVGGVLVAADIKQEVYPAYELDIVNFSMPLPGATPEEVEEGILLPAEEAVRGLEAVKRIEATAVEGNGSMSVELVEDVDPNRALQDIKNAIDRVSSFPEEAERPRVELAIRQRSTVTIAIAADMDERTLFEFAERVRNDLLAYDEITQVEVRGIRNPEITIEVPQAQLRALNLTLDDIAETVRAAARDVPGGEVRTEGGEVLLRSAGRRFFASEYYDIPVVSAADGARLKLGDIATITDGFEDVDRVSTFNGKPGVTLWVYQTGDQKPLDIAELVYGYVERMNHELPDSVEMNIMWDRAREYRERLELLLKNGAFGMGLVLLVLAVFLAPKLAFWVGSAVPVCILGGIMLLPAMDTTINMISLFAFIITLGILVDDAVIIGEEVFENIQRGATRMDAAIAGAKQMGVPVLFAVLTNIVAFVPLMFVPGRTGRFFAAIPLVVITVFVISLVESLFILPAHLAHATAVDPQRRGLLPAIARVQTRLAAGFERLTVGVYQPIIAWTLRYRGLTVATFLAGLIVVAAWYESGRINFTFNPRIEGDRVDAEVRVPFGAPFSETTRVANLIEHAGLRAADHFGPRDQVLDGWMNGQGRMGSNTADVNFVLVPQEQREFTPADFVRAWRDEIGPLPGLESLYFEWEVGPSGSRGLTVELSHPDRRTLEAAAHDFATTLQTYTGVTDIDDGFAAGKPQLDLTITDAARALGLTHEAIGRQIRHAYYGAEALRMQRARNEVKVMVRLPESERRSLADLENMVVRTPAGGEMPLFEAVDLTRTRAYTEIKRVNAQRVLTVTANIVPELTNVNKVRADLEANVLPELQANHPGLSFTYGGRQQEEIDAMHALLWGLGASLAVIFGMLAAIYRSYGEALITMLIVPFAIAAALLGHIVMGYDLSVVSVLGIIATCGVVVNGGLVLTVTMNDLIARGVPFERAALEASRRRFRPILLTSLTTFMGLTPMIFETSPQARYLIPMAIALGFGIMFSAAVVLLMMPACHVIVHSLGHRPAADARPDGAAAGLPAPSQPSA